MLTAIDFYKADHRSQYPLGTQMVYSNLTPRSNKIMKRTYPDHDDKVVVLLRPAIARMVEGWQRDFFDKPLKEVLAKYKNRMDKSLGPGAITFDHIKALHELGYLPIAINTIPDGATVKVGTPVFTMFNTVPDFFWITNYLETQLSAMTWRPMTVATIAREYRKLLDGFADMTCDSNDHVAFQAHDFSARGLDGLDGMRGQVGHLMYFLGTDTVFAIDEVEDHYVVDPEDPIGMSVPATEHSVMCMGGKESEMETFRRLMKIYPQGILSVVSDTWDYWKVLTEILPALKGEILARQPILDPDGNIVVLGKLVVRPDSGDPVKIITGYALDEYEYDENGIARCVVTGKALTTEEIKGSIVVLDELFGSTINSKGYRELHPQIGLIYGDSITYERAKTILGRLKDKGYASNNVVFGIGSFTYQYLTRDTLGFAVKATFGIIDKEQVSIQKDPATDDGTKKSAKGILEVDTDGNLHQFSNFEEVSNWVDQNDSLLDCILLNGQLEYKQEWNDVRNRASM